MSKKTFKEYYDSDPKFRENHLNYCQTKIQCKCGSITARCNMTKHKKTNKHIKWEEQQSVEKKLAKIHKILKTK